MIERPQYLNDIRHIFAVHPICAILGPRQCGKTTLAKMYQQTTSEKVYHFDLEDPTDLVKLESPKLALEPLQGLVIIDEIQRRPELFPYLRVLVDNQPHRKFLILGSVSRDLIHQSSETLAGRIGYIELSPLLLNEVPDIALLWERGGFPPSYLASSEKNSMLWRTNYVRNYLERDLAMLDLHLPSQQIRRLWMMLAHYHANILNMAELGRSLQLSERTIRKYLDILAGTYMIRLLPAWFENISKRQVKSPKVYIRDSGLLHTLLGISAEHIRLHPKTGASWEGFALEQVIQITQTNTEDCYFWSTQHAAELDLLLVKPGKRQGFEIKYTDAPRITKSMHHVLTDLKIDKLTIIIPGQDHFLLSKHIQVYGLSRFATTIASTP